MLETLLNLLILFGILAIASALVLIPLVRLQKHQQKQKAIRDYVRRVGRVLRVRYGKRPSYTPHEVKQMLSEWGYSTSFDCYCLALYCDRTAFNTYHQSIGESCDYGAMRQEVCAHLPFSGSGFDAVDVIELGDRLNTQGRSSDPSDSDYSENAREHTSDFITNDYSGSNGDSGGGDYSGGDFGGGGFD